MKERLKALFYCPGKTILRAVDKNLSLQDGGRNLFTMQEYIPSGLHYCSA
ncbi:MAG: hypothetical protein AB2L14_16895 [Candidatus Xenobiia bacterium LiM19]